MRRWFLVASFVALVASAVVAAPAAADAPQVGPVTIEAAGTFGEPGRGFVLPWAGRVKLSGIVTGEAADGISGAIVGFEDGAFYADGWHIVDEMGGIWDVGLSCRLERDAAGSLTGGECRSFGDLIAGGFLVVTAVELRPGGVFNFTVRFPSVLCPSC